MKRKTLSIVAGGMNLFNAGSFECLTIRDHDLVSLLLCVVSLLLGAAFLVAASHTEAMAS